MTEAADLLVEATRFAVGTQRVGLHDPLFGPEEEEWLASCLASNYVSSVGPFVDDFEKLLAREVGANFAIAMVNGTSALHIAFILAGVRPGDEVAMSPLSFVAPANAASYVGAAPLFFDIDSENLGPDPKALRRLLLDVAKLEDGHIVNRRSGARISAVVALHALGFPCRIDEIRLVAEEFGLVVVEDAAEALGSRFRGEPVLKDSRFGILSFNGNKIVTTGGGGAFVTMDEDLAQRARHLSTTAKIPHRWRYVHDKVGYNYRMPNVNAALGMAQLGKLVHFLGNKRALHERYSVALSGVDEVSLLEEAANAESNYWLNTVRLAGEAVANRDILIDALNGAGYGSRPAWDLLSSLLPYQSAGRGDLALAEEICPRLISLPSGPGIS